MSILGEALIESLQKSTYEVGPEKEKIPMGFAGTKTDNLAELIARYTELAKEKGEPKKPGWLSALQTPFTAGPAMVGSLISMLRGKKQEKTDTGTFNEITNRVIPDLRTKGYEEEMIQELIDALAKNLNQKTIDISKI